MPRENGVCTMMNKTNYKTISVVAVNNVALAMSKNESNEYKHMKKLGANNIIASLKVLKSVLTSIDNNDCLANQPRLIILGSKSPIKGFAVGSYVEYLRTGANASGKKFNNEEMTLIKECAELYANKCFNVRITTDEFVSYKDKETKALIDGAWKQIKAIAQQMMTQAKQVQQLKETKEKKDDKTAETIAKLQDQVVKLTLEGKFDDAKKVSELIKNLQTTSEELNETMEHVNENEIEIPNDVVETNTNEDPLAGAEDME